jgi:hypothetical protein
MENMREFHFRNLSDSQLDQEDISLFFWCFVGSMGFYPPGPRDPTLAMERHVQLDGTPQISFFSPLFICSMHCHCRKMG